jgi:hypothetical protein
MTYPSIVKGQYWDIAVSLDGGTTFTTICGLTSRGNTQQVNTSDNAYRDCQDPTQVPFRSLNTTSQQMDMTGTGVYNRAQGDLIRSIIGKSLPYRFIKGEDASDPVDSGYYEGKFVLTQFQETAADFSDVTAQFTWASDGPYDWVPGADIVVLDALSLTPRAAVHATQYNGTVSGTTTGSTLAATSDDGTTLTVTGTGATRTVASGSGGFAAAGNKTITLTETLAGASNTPRVTKTIIAVS